MISVIISSVNKDYLKKVSENIADTIGVPFEIIAIENREDPRGICEVYNRGIQQAKYNMLCFAHEDITFKTNNWGSMVLQLFADHPDYGLFGVAGSDYKSLAPSGWNGSGTDTDYSNIIQNFKFQDKKDFHYYKNYDNKKIAQVVCIDGVWFCAPKKIAEEVMFDEDVFKGFHAYDLDFSFAVARKYKVGVTFDILIDHFSEGNFDRTWLEEILKFHKKWNHHLPVNLRPFPRNTSLSTEKHTFQYFIDRLIHFKLPISTAFKVLYMNNNFRKLDTWLFLKLHYYIIKKGLRAKSSL